MKRVRFAIKLVALAMFIAFLPVNLDSSIPRGLYWTTYETAHRGDVARICQPQRVVDEERRLGIGWFGWCHGGLHVFKVLAAVPGDVLDVSPARIAVNGVAQPNTARRYRDRAGRPIVQWLRYGRYTVPPGQVLVLGSNPDSFDGRTFGLIPLSSVGARLHPVPYFTWKG